MTSKERWLAVLDRKTPDRVPMDIWATQETFNRLLKHLGCTFDEMLERLHIDMPLTVNPAYAGPPLEADRDMWDITYRDVDYGAGVYREAVTSPLASYQSVDEIDAHYTWPSADWFDFSGIPGQVRGNEHRIIRGGGSEPFLTYKSLRGEQLAFMDLLANPEIVHYCMDKMFGLCYEVTRRIFETVPGAVSITYVAEDLAGQEGLMYSPGQIREYLLPHMRRMNELTRQHGSHVFFHSDGAVREILPDIIGIGAEVLNPIQWRCPGMEREGLKADFGGQLVFHGGVDNQHTLPFGSISEVRDEVLDNLRILGAGGGYILAPCHNLQPITPPENIVTMYETGYANGWT
jgi:uroporphyrinogen decarboxylase